MRESFARRFFEQVDAAPDRLAVSAGSRQLNYAETAANAGRIGTEARALLGAVANPAPVALLTGQDVELVVGTLALYLAGVAYVPMDPQQPRARLETLLAFIEAPLIVTDRANADLARDLAGDRAQVQVIEVQPGVAPVSFTPLETDGEEPALAYFTSGSTGEPKGILYPRQAIRRGIDCYLEFTSLTADDRVGKVARCGFAVSVFDILPPLMIGASVHTYDIIAGGIDGMKDWLVKERIALVNCVPTVFRRVAARVHDPAEFRHFRLWNVGGEPVLASDYKLMRERFGPTIPMLHVLGATEVGHIAYHIVDDQTDLSAGVLPFVPLSDTVVRLVDENGNQVKAGRIGELILSGRHIPEGYWKRPDLSEGKFSVAPDDPEARSYHTGDLAMLRPDGLYVHMGRKDDQLKISGVRVDPVEVQSIISGLGSLREAIVLARPYGNYGRRLIAYVVPRDPASFSVEALRLQAAKLLPIVMMPSAFVVLDDLPVNASIKVDRGRLPDPPPPVSARADPGTLTGKAAESDIVTAGIILAFQQILKIEEVGPDDNFFEMGGDSLRAVELALLIEENFNVNLSPSVLAAAWTPTMLTKVVDWQLQVGGAPGVIALNAKADNSSSEAGVPLFCLPGLGGLVMSFRHLATALGPDQPCYGLEYPGYDGASAPMTSVVETARQLVARIQSTAPEGPVALAGYSMGGAVAYEVSRQLETAGREVALLALFDTTAPSVMRHRDLARARAWLRFMFDPARADKFGALAREARRVPKKLIDYARGDKAIYDLVGGEDAGGLFSGFSNKTIQQAMVASYHAVQSYRPGAHERELLLFRSEATVTPPYSPEDLYREWNELTGGQMKVIVVPGGHDDILVPPVVDEVAAHMRARLSPAVGGRPQPLHAPADSLSL